MKKFPSLATAVLGAGLMAAATPTATADVFYGISAIAAPGMVTDSGAGSLNNVIQGPGSGFDATPPHDGPSATWYTDAITSNYITGHPGDEKLLFDLGSDVCLGEISVWGYAATNGNGLREFNVRFATDAEGGAAGLGDESYGSSITFNPAYTALIDPIPRQSFLFGQAVTARYVEVHVTSNYAGLSPGGDRLGVGEIAFSAGTVAAASEISVADINIPFGATTANYNIPVGNTGQLDLNVTGATFSGTNSGAFSLVSLPGPICTWDTGDIVVQFDPTGLFGQSISVTMAVTSDDPDESPINLLITGVVGPVIQVTSPAPLSLGSVVDTFDIDVENVGGVTLNISGADFIGDDMGAFTATVVPSSIAPAGLETLTIQFDPAGLEPGPVDATLRIMSDDPTTPTALVVIDGGVPAQFHPISGVTTNTVNFFLKENMIEGSGVGFDASWPHNAMGTLTWVTDAPNGSFSSYYANAQPAPVLIFDLGQDRVLSEISTWGYASDNTNGGKDFTLRFATDADGLSNFGTSVAYTPSFEAAFSPTTRDANYFTLAVTARYVEMTVTSNWMGLVPPLAGGDRVGFGEIAFEDRGGIPSTVYETWSRGNGLSGADALSSADVENGGAGDSLNNFLEFAFGTDPNVVDLGSLSWNGVDPVVPGGPVADVSFPGVGVDFKARFVRRKDHGTTGSVSYAWRFSSDLTDWESSDATPSWLVAPTVLANDASGVYELVEVPYPLFLDSNAKKARFFQVVMTQL